MASDPDGAPARDERLPPVVSIALQVQHLSTGDRAQLRRLYLTGRHEADGIVIRMLHAARVTIPDDPDSFAPWRLLAHCAALLSGTGGKAAHAGGRRLGAELSAIGLSENRLLRLTAVRGAGLRAQVIRVTRMLAQRSDAAVDLRTLFDLIYTDPDRAERARIRIAQDYYAAEARSKKEDESDD